MTDPRIDELAELLVNYSCRVKPGDKVLIEAIDVPEQFAAALVRSVVAAEGVPAVLLKSNQLNRQLMLTGTEAQWDFVADVERHQMEQVQCYIGARGSGNVSEMADVPRDKQKLYEQSVWRRVHHEIRVKKTRWVVLRWPSSAMAQLAEMSTEAFEDLYFNVCTLDYDRLSKAMEPLVELMEQTDRVRLKGPADTDLTFSIKDIPVISCDGKRNIPDGEVFTAPVRDSINGVIQFNTPTLYRGATHLNVRLVFENGKIVDASSSDTARLNEVLDADEGARYTGEFAVGVNPYCTRAMKDILFDEKIAGSIHLTPGACYDEASNGNKSDIHWDLVLMQTEEVGGGEMWFDDQLVRKDGLFVVDQLLGLNPEQLR